MTKFECHVFICTNRRPDWDPKGSCAKSGSEHVLAAFKDGLSRRALNSRIRANAAGCLDACADGPAVVVYPDGVWYGRVRPEDVEEIIEEHLVKGKPVERLRIAESK